MGEAIRQMCQAAGGALVVAPIGFLSDHLEVLYDLDVEARGLCDQLGVHMRGAGTVGTHPQFVRTIVELIAERLSGTADRPTVGGLGPSPDTCAADCCRYSPRRPEPGGRQPFVRVKR